MNVGISGSCFVGPAPASYNYIANRSYGAVLDIQILLICAVIGVLARAFLGLNLLALFGAVSIVSLLIPAFLISLSSNPEASHNMANTLDLYVVNFTKVLPSVIIGELLGFFAKDILRLPKTLIDHIRTLL